MRLTKKASRTTVGIDPRTIIFYFAHTMIHDQHPEGHGMEGWRRIVSGLTMPLIRAAERGDTSANDILDEGATSLAEQMAEAIETSKHRHGFNPQSPLVLYGGVVTHHPFFRNLVVKHVRRLCPGLTEILDAHTPRTMRPACGALLFALGQSRTGNMRLPSVETINTVRQTLHPFPALYNT
jgi:hypothetical protein